MGGIAGNEEEERKGREKQERGDGGGACEGVGSGGARGKHSSARLQALRTLDIDKRVHRSSGTTKAALG